MMYTIDSETFYSFTKNMWIGDSGASCHIMNNNTGMFVAINIDKLIQGGSSIMSTTKKGKLQVHVWQVDKTEWVHTLWPMKFCPNIGANLFPLMCKLSQENTISIDHQINIMVSSTNGDIIFDCHIKTCKGWVAGVKFF